MKRKIPLAKPFFGAEEVNAVRKVLKSGWVAQGPQVAEFEKEFAAYSGVKHGVAVNSCTSGLHLSLLSLNLSKDDEIILPDFTFTATGNAVFQIGAKPKIVDIDLTNFNIDIQEIEEQITDNVKAIIPVHAFGYPLEMDKINKIANKHGIKIIEDAALGLGSAINEKKTGSFGNIACFSLQGRKVITTGEGGLIAVDDDENADVFRSLRSQGIHYSKINNSQFQTPIYKTSGFSYRLSDIQACIGVVQLRKIDQFVKRRQYLASYYYDEFEDNGLDVVYYKPGKNINYNYQSFIITIKHNRDKLIINLKSEGIESTIGTYSLSGQPFFNQITSSCPNSKYAFEHALSLPMFHELTETNISYIVKKLKKHLQ